MGIAAVAGGFVKHTMMEARTIPDDLRPLPLSFWVRKTHTPDKFNVTIIGDSRVYRGVAPEVLEQELPGTAVLNLGYSSAGLAGDLCRLAEEKLVPSGLRCIVLGVSPLSLFPSSSENEHLNQFTRISGARGWLLSEAPWIDVLFSPRPAPDVANWVLKRGDWASPESFRKGNFQIPHGSGWVESWRVPEKPDWALASYAKKFAAERPSPKVLGELCGFVSRWHAAGILVIAFRPPSTLRMERLEDRMSLLPEQEIRRRLTGNGAKWLDITDRYGYHSYDGSHLTADAARRLSGVIGKGLREALAE